MENEETLTCGSGNHNKIKADYAGIIARRVSIQKYKETTYFEILYLDTGDNVWHVGFGSYMLEFVEMWLNTEFENTYKPITTAITDLLSRAEAAEAAQETLQRAMSEYKARAEKAERERDAAISTVNNAYRAGAITVKDPRFILPGVESKGWYRTVSVLGDQHVEPNKKVVFRFEDEVSKPSEDQWSWIMGRFMKGE